MQTPLDVRYESPRTADLLLQIPRQDTRLCGFPSRPRQDSAEGSQDRHGRLERRKLMGCQRWVGGQMTPDQGGDVGRVLHAAFSRSVPDGEPVSRPQTDRDPVQGGTAARWVGRQVGRLGIEQCTNSDQGQRRFRYLPLGGDRGEQALLLRRRTRRDRRGRRFRGAVVYCSPTCVAANRGHFACHHSNTDPTTDLDPKFLLISDPPIRTYTLRELLRVCGEGFAVFSGRNSPRASATLRSVRS